MDCSPPSSCVCQPATFRDVSVRDVLGVCARDVGDVCARDVSDS